VKLAPKTWKVVLNWLQLVVLFTPSAWMLLRINPLWRDIDGYNQVTLPPGPMTILQFSPLYCFGSRIPLYLGYALDRGEFPARAFYNSPILTDSGVFLLIVFQHLFLLAAQWFLLRSIQANHVTKVILAALLALNAPFYTYTHSIGTEALSLSATLMLLGCALRVWRQRHIKRSAWVWLGLSLILCVLTRPINAVLGMFLPMAFAFQGIAETGQSAIRRSSAQFPRRLITRHLFLCGLSLVVAALSFAVADRTVRYVCRASKLKYRSTVGQSFAWRLNFLAQMDEKERTEMLGRVAEPIGDPVVKQMIAATSSGISGPGKWDAQACTHKFVEIIEQHSSIQTDLSYQLDLCRNRLARVFLLSCERPFLDAVRSDFLSAFAISPRELAVFPIATTRYCFSRIQEMPQLATLATFRGATADATLAAQERLTYYRLLDVPFRNLLLVWVGLTAAVFFAVKKGRIVVVASIVLIGTGVTMVLLTCFLSELLPRFTLPFWALYVTATLLSVGPLCDRIGGGRFGISTGSIS
jgi:hypothetical protein